jgi:hypothetical protein
MRFSAYPGTPRARMAGAAARHSAAVPTCQLAKYRKAHFEVTVYLILCSSLAISIPTAPSPKYSLHSSKERAAAASEFISHPAQTSKAPGMAKA